MNLRVSWVIVYGWRPIVATIGVVAAAWLGVGAFRAQRALDEATSEHARAAIFRYRARTLAPASTPFEPIAAPAAFIDAVAFEGRLYVAGSAGLFAYKEDGTLAGSFRVGIEIPSAPLTALATGLAPDRGSRHVMVGTRGQGLLLFDGRTFRQIRPEDPAAGRVTSIIPLASSRVVFGTETRGVLSWDGRTITALHPELDGLHVTALAGDDRELWIGTTAKGVLRLLGGEVRAFSESEGLPDPHVLAIAQREDTVWAATALGVGEFRDGRFTRRLAEGFTVRSLLPRGGALFAGTLEDEIIEIPLESRQRISHPRAIEGPGEAVRLFEFDKHVHALTPYGLYAEGSHGSWRPVLKDENARLADRNVAALAADARGRLWIGYFDSGLEILDAGSVRVARFLDDRLYCINRIVHDSTRQRSAVATANGLALFDGDGSPRQVLTRENGLIATHTTDVAFTPDGLIAATPAGLTFVDAGGSRSLYAFHGLVNNHVYALAASGNRVVAGTLGGLSVLESGVVRANFTTANSALRHNWITAIVPVDDGFFVGTYGAGVMRVDASSRFARFSDFPPDAEINPGALLATPQAVYAGTLGRGLAAYSRTSGRWTFLTEGLPSMSVTALSVDRGMLYVGTDNGIVRAPEERLRLP